MKLAAGFTMLLPVVSLAVTPVADASPLRLFSGPGGWHDSGLRGMRGITIGPIENGYHPGLGYGSPAYGRTLDECVAMGARWVALTPFGRVLDLSGRGVDPTFERPHA